MRSPSVFRAIDSRAAPRDSAKVLNAREACVNVGAKMKRAMRCNWDQTRAVMSITCDVGGEAPDFDLAAGPERRITLKEFRGKKLVLYFYPRDDTSGCTAEAIDFNALKGEFAKAGAAVVGVSPDSVKSHDRFRAKHDLALDLAADPDKAVVSAYGVWVEKSMYGRKYMGVERSTFLIDREGLIASVWRKVKVAGHAQEVLAAVRAAGAAERAK